MNAAGSAPPRPASPSPVASSTSSAATPTPRRLVRAALWGALGASLVGAAVACGLGFDTQARVNSVRMFGVRADKPYAKPGDVVTLEVLATDSRPVRPRPLKIYWVPLVCINPRDDLYYLCFLPPSAGIDGGARFESPFPGDAGAGGLASIPQGIDLGPFLPEGPTFTFRVPDDVVQPREGSVPYGLAVVFNMACAGQIRIAERTGGSPQQIPLQCTDEAGNPLGPDDYVIGINRVYAYLDRDNTNPVVENVTLDGGVVDVAQGITIDRCVASRRGDCPPVKLGVRVSDSSWEENPGTGRASAQREQIWVTYYANVGDFQDEARLLFDPKTGRITDSDIEYRAPYEAAEGTVWAVVHDNRAGASFITLPVHVK